MKKLLIIVALMFAATGAWAQEPATVTVVNKTGADILTLYVRASDIGLWVTNELSGSGPLADNKEIKVALRGGGLYDFRALGKGGKVYLKSKRRIGNGSNRVEIVPSDVDSGK